MRGLDAAAALLDVSISQTRPRFFAWIGGSGLEIGVIADALMASHDVNVAVESGAATPLEQQAVRWIGEFVGFAADADGMTAAGGTISNLTALTAARERAVPGIRHRGAGGQRLALYCSVEAHYSVRRAAEVLGIGRTQRAHDPDRREPADGSAAHRGGDRRRPPRRDRAGRRRRHRRHDADGRGRRPRRARRTSARSASVWLHVDGAYGLPAAATALAGRALRGPRPRRLGDRRRAQVAVRAEGLQHAARSATATRFERTFTHDESYIPHTDREDSSHPVDRTLEYSRPLSALKLWLAFRVHGASAIRAAIERNLRQARDARRPGARGPAARAARRTAAHRGVLPHRPPPGVDPGAHNAALAREISAEGRILLAPATVDGVACLRACIVNHRTGDDDVRAIVEVVREAAGRLGPLS